MGKIGDAEQAVASPAPATGGGFTHGVLCQHVALAVKCVLLLFLGIGVFVPAFFLLLPLHPPGTIPDIQAAEIQASFVLLKPASELASNIGRLEDDIFRDIGVPNSTVSVISMKALAPEDRENSTYVTFGVLPDPKNSSISFRSLSALRSSLIGLALEQLNLSLTPSVFGDPLCIEMLGFPGGITVEPPQSDSILYSAEPLCNVTLNNTIHQIRDNLEELKDQLRCTLKLASDENLFVQIINENGSTVTPPVTVHVFVSSNNSNIDLQPCRLRQLAQVITESDSRNLGLNPFVFGTVMDVKFSSSLQHFMPSLAPSFPPMPLPYLSSPPSSQPSTTDPQKLISCPALVSSAQQPKRTRPTP